MAILKKLYTSHLKIGDDSTNLIVLRVVISGGFASAAEFNEMMNDIYRNKINGAVLSCGVRFNFYSVPSSFILSPLNQYNSYTATTYGDDTGFKIVTTKTNQNLAGVSQVNAVHCTSASALYYKGNRVANIYSGGYGSTGLVLLPVVIFTNEDGYIYTLSQGTNVNSFVNETSYLTSADISLSEVYPLPLVVWDSDKLISFRGQGTDAMARGITLSGDNITSEIDGETPVGPGPDPGDDPYGPGGDSDAGGGGGSFDYDSIITGGFDDFQLPQNSAVDTGFLTLYNPSAAELKSLSNYLWSNSFDLDTFKKLVNDPMDLILGLSILPIQVPQGERREIGIGLIGTDIYMTTIPTQWVKVDCGSVTIPNFIGSYLDYDPYTSVEIYLPFIGTRTLKADEVMGRTISVGYAIDILSGACVAWIDVDGSLMYTYMGQCATSIPVVSGDWTNVINGILSVVGSAAGGAIKGGVGGAIAGGVAAASSVAVNDSKISVERSGNISGAGGLLAYKRPFIIINAPRICKPANQNLYTGYPSYITQRIGDISGYTEIEVLRLYNIPATDPEIDEIRSLLMGGVIL